jgi:hypothetical protein
MRNLLILGSLWEILNWSLTAWPIERRAHGHFKIINSPSTA